MSKYYIFGSESFDTISLDVDLDKNIVRLEAGKDHLVKDFSTYYKLDKLKLELQTFLKYLEQLESWKNKNNVR